GAAGESPWTGPGARRPRKARNAEKAAWHAPALATGRYPSNEAPACRSHFREETPPVPPLTETARAMAEPTRAPAREPTRGAATAPADSYSARHLSVLEGLEAVRKRPGMYVGSTDGRGLQHCLWEIFDNAVDEALAGYCTRVEVILHADGSAEVRDNGRGIPV